MQYDLVYIAYHITLTTGKMRVGIFLSTHTKVCIFSSFPFNTNTWSKNSLHLKYLQKFWVKICNVQFFSSFFKRARYIQSKATPGSCITKFAFKIRNSEIHQASFLHCLFRGILILPAQVRICTRQETQSKKIALWLWFFTYRMAFTPSFEWI